MKEVLKFKTLEELSRAAANEVLKEIEAGIRRSGRFTIALSGGHTPSGLYSILASDYRDRIKWDAVHFFFGDERYVPHTDNLSNFKMAKLSLLDVVPVPRVNVHAIPTMLADADVSAKKYEEELRKTFAGGTQTFDLLLLGMGKEGHTASLFPRSPALDEKDRWVLPVVVPIVPPERITLTYDALNRSRATFLLVAGEDKAETVGKVLGRDADYHTFPVKGIHPMSGKLVWYLDAAAASRL